MSTTRLAPSRSALFATTGGSIQPNTDYEIRLYSLRVQSLAAALLPNRVNEFGDANVFCSMRCVLPAAATASAEHQEGEEEEENYATSPIAVTNMTLLDANGSGRFDVGGFAKGSLFFWNSCNPPPAMEFTFWSFLPAAQQGGSSTTQQQQQLNTSGSSNNPHNSSTTARKKFSGFARVLLHPPMLVDGDIEFQGAVGTRTDEEAQEFLAMSDLGKVFFTVGAVPAKKRGIAGLAVSGQQQHQPPALSAAQRLLHLTQLSASAPAVIASIPAARLVVTGGANSSSGGRGTSSQPSSSRAASAGSSSADGNNAQHLAEKQRSSTVSSRQEQQQTAYSNFNNTSGSMDSSGAPTATNSASVSNMQLGAQEQLQHQEPHNNNASSCSPVRPDSSLENTLVPSQHQEQQQQRENPGRGGASGFGVAPPEAQLTEKAPTVASKNQDENDDGENNSDAFTVASSARCSAFTPGTSTNKSSVLPSSAAAAIGSRRVVKAAPAAGAAVHDDEPGSLMQADSFHISESEDELEQAAPAESIINNSNSKTVAAARAATSSNNEGRQPLLVSENTHAITETSFQLKPAMQQQQMQPALKSPQSVQGPSPFTPVTGSKAESGAKRQQQQQQSQSQRPPAAQQVLFEIAEEDDDNYASPLSQYAPPSENLQSERDFSYDQQQRQDVSPSAHIRSVSVTVHSAAINTRTTTRVAPGQVMPTAADPFVSVYAVVAFGVHSNNTKSNKLYKVGTTPVAWNTAYPQWHKEFCLENKALTVSGVSQYNNNNRTNNNNNVSTMKAAVLPPGCDKLLFVLRDWKDSLSPSALHGPATTAVEQQQQPPEEGEFMGMCELGGFASLTASHAQKNVSLNLQPRFGTAFQERDLELLAKRTGNPNVHDDASASFGTLTVSFDIQVDVAAARAALAAQKRLEVEQQRRREQEARQSVTENALRQFHAAVNRGGEIAPPFVSTPPSASRQQQQQQQQHQSFLSFTPVATSTPPAAAQRDNNNKNKNNKKPFAKAATATARPRSASPSDYSGSESGDSVSSSSVDDDYQEQAQEGKLQDQQSQPRQREAAVQSTGIHPAALAVRSKIGVTLLSATGDVAPDHALLAAQVACFAQDKAASAGHRSQSSRHWTAPSTARGGLCLFTHRQEFVVTHAQGEGVMVSVIVAMKSAETAIIEQTRGGGVSTPQIQPESRLFAAVRVDPAEVVRGSRKPKVLTCELYNTVEAAFRHAFEDKSSPSRLRSGRQQQTKTPSSSLGLCISIEPLSIAPLSLVSGAGVPRGVNSSSSSMHSGAVFHLCIMGASKLDRIVKFLLAQKRQQVDINRSSSSSSYNAENEDGNYGGEEEEEVRLYCIVRMRSSSLKSSSVGISEREFRSPTVRLASSSDSHKNRRRTSSGSRSRNDQPSSSAALTPRWYFSPPPIDCALQPDVTVSVFLEDAMGFDELVGAAEVPFVRIVEQDAFVPDMALPLFFSDEDRARALLTKKGGGGKNFNNNNYNNNHQVAHHHDDDDDEGGDYNSSNSNGVLSISAAIRPNPLNPSQQHHQSSHSHSSRKTPSRGGAAGSPAATLAHSSHNNSSRGDSANAPADDVAAFLEVHLIQASNLIQSATFSPIVVARVLPSGSCDMVSAAAVRDDVTITAGHAERRNNHNNSNNKSPAASGCTWPPTAEPGQIPGAPTASLSSAANSGRARGGVGGGGGRESQDAIVSSIPPLLFELQAPPSSLRFSLWDSESKHDAHFLGEYDLFLDTANCVVGQTLFVNAALRPRADALYQQDDLETLNAPQNRKHGFGALQARVLMLSRAQHEERCRLRELAQRALHEYTVQLQVVEAVDVPFSSFSASACHNEDVNDDDDASMNNTGSDDQQQQQQRQQLRQLHRIEAHAGDPYSGGAPTVHRTAFEPGENPKFRQNMRFTLFRTTELIHFVLQEKRIVAVRKNRKKRRSASGKSRSSNNNNNTRDGGSEEEEEEEEIIVAIAEGTLPVSTPESVGTEPRTTWTPLRLLSGSGDRRKKQQQQSASSSAPRLFVRWRVFYPDDPTGQQHMLMIQQQQQQQQQQSSSSSSTPAANGVTPPVVVVRPGSSSHSFHPASPALAAKSSNHRPALSVPTTPTAAAASSVQHQPLPPPPPTVVSARGNKGVYTGSSSSAVVMPAPTSGRFAQQQQSQQQQYFNNHFSPVQHVRSVPMSSGAAAGNTPGQQKPQYANVYPPEQKQQQLRRRHKKHDDDDENDDDNEEEEDQAAKNPSLLDDILEAPKIMPSANHQRGGSKSPPRVIRPSAQTPAAEQLDSTSSRDQKKSSNSSNNNNNNNANDDDEESDIDKNASMFSALAPRVSIQVYAPLHGVLSTYQGRTIDRVSDVVAFAHTKFRLDATKNFKISKPGLVLGVDSDPTLGDLISRGALAPGDTVFLVQGEPTTTTTSAVDKKNKKQQQQQQQQKAGLPSDIRPSAAVRYDHATELPLQQQQQPEEVLTPSGLLRAREIEYSTFSHNINNNNNNNNINNINNANVRQTSAAVAAGLNDSSDEGGVVFNAPPRRVLSSARKRKVSSGSHGEQRGDPDFREDVVRITERLRELSARARAGDLVRSTLQLILKGTISCDAPVALAITRYFARCDPEATVCGFTRRNEEAVDSLDIVMQGHPTKLADALEAMPLQLPLWQQLSNMSSSVVDSFAAPPAVFHLSLVQLFGYLPVLRVGFTAFRSGSEAKFAFGLAAKRYSTPQGLETDQCWFYRDFFGLSESELARSKLPFSKIVDERG